MIAAWAVGLAALPACGTGHGGTSYCAAVARVVTAGIRIIVGRFPSAIAITPDGTTAYVTDSFDGTVTPIRLATGIPGTPVKVAQGPLAIAITPDGKTAYVTSIFEDPARRYVPRPGVVTPISLATGTPGTPIKVGQGPIGIAITPDGTTAYVANSAGSTVTPIRLATGIPGTPVKVAQGPLAIAITPDGKTAYVTSIFEDPARRYVPRPGVVTPISLATGTPGTPIKVGQGPIGIAVTPDGKTAYVTSALAEVIRGLFIPRAGDVTPIRLATGTPGRPIQVGRVPSAIAITPDGATAWVTGQADGTITPIRLTTGTPGTPVTVGSNPTAIAITPDGATAYVADFGDSAVTPVGLAAGTPRNPIKVPPGPHSIAISPDGKTAYVTSLQVAPSLRRLQTAPPGMVTPICLPSSR